MTQQNSQRIKIGTRGSDLALYQTNFVRNALCEKFPSLSIDIIEIKTLGDKKQGTSQAAFGDKKDWVYELEMALLDQSIDIAIHCGKDIPGNTEPGLSLIPVMERESPYDIFIGRKKESGGRFSFEETLSQYSHSGSFKIGTASLRRKAAIKKSYPLTELVDHRGNVPTRIKKLDEDSSLSGIILAEAGVVRLKALSKNEFSRIPFSISVPAMNQGILAAQFRDDNFDIKDKLEAISSIDLKSIFFAEREVAKILEGDCKTAIGIFAELKTKEQGTLYCEVYDPNGIKSIKSSKDFALSDWKSAANALCDELIMHGAKALL